MDASAPLMSAELAELERRKRAKSLPVPTDDAKVKLRLRELGHPICLFGEDAHDRRERLREEMSCLTDSELSRFLASFSESASEAQGGEEEEFFTEGPPELHAARMDILKYSLERAKKRLVHEREQQAVRVRDILQRKELAARLATHSNEVSQLGDERPLSFCTFGGPDGSYVATGSMQGGLRLFSSADCRLVHAWAGHKDRIGGIAFHPMAYQSLSPDAGQVLSGAADGSVRLWNLTHADPVASFVGHTNRVARVAFHPSGRYAATASFDTSWRLWDVETQQELALQEGHSKEVYDIAFHCDGSLAISGSLDAHGRVWDLRTGRSVMVLDGHVKPVTAVAASPNGVHVATGAQDNAIMVWDLRKRKSTATIPAHTAVVSHLKFEPTMGECLVSASFDRTAKVWMYPDWRPVRTLIGHEKQVVAVDVTAHGETILTASFDHTFKLWKPEGAPLKRDTDVNME